MSNCLDEMEGVWTEDEINAVTRLLRMAEVVDREYKIRSRIPIIGPLIVWLRRNLTTHLREAYFDPMMERQVAFNRRAAEAVCAAWQRLKDLQALPVAEAEHEENSVGQQVIAEARRAAQPVHLCNAELLAGPLPEYGECLGRGFYRALHSTALASMAGLDEAQNLEHLELYERARWLARRIETHWFWIARFYADTLDPETPLRGYCVRSSHRFIGPLIVWIRRTVTAHLREGYIDPVMKRQVTFNRLVRSALRTPDALNPSMLEQLRAAASAVPQPYRVHSTLPLVGSFVAWARRQLTAHLDIPYIVPALERQAAFNHALVDMLTLTGERVAEQRMRERRDAVPAIRRELAQLAAGVVGEGEFQARMRQLISDIDACMAGW